MIPGGDFPCCAPQTPPGGLAPSEQSGARPAAPHDPVNHPQHYASHPSGIECITIAEHMGFNVGNAVKYLWRADEKGSALEDLRKAAWYVQREIEKRLRDIDTALDKLPTIPQQPQPLPPVVSS